MHVITRTWANGRPCPPPSTYGQAVAARALCLPVACSRGCSGIPLPGRAHHAWATSVAREGRPSRDKPYVEFYFDSCENILLCNIIVLMKLYVQFSHNKRQMDRQWQWMYNADRWTMEFNDDLYYFLKVTKTNKSEKGFTYCPFTQCRNIV